MKRSPGNEYMTTASNEVKPAAKSKEAKADKVKAVEQVKPVVPVLKVCGNVVPIEALQTAISAAMSEAGRARSEAQKLGLGRIAKDVSGHGTLIPTVSVLNDLSKLQYFGADKVKAKAKSDRIKGLNMLVDGLAMLGLAIRQNG